LIPSLKTTRSLTEHADNILVSSLQRCDSPSFCPNAYRPSLIVYSVTLFSPWAIWGMSVGRFGRCCGPLRRLPWAYQKFMGRFGRGHFGSWAVLEQTRFHISTNQNDLH